jgi:membrane-associated phospholipid phosphatase
MARLLVAGVLAVLLAHLVDGWAYHHFQWRAIYDGDFGRMLRIIGYVPFWLLAALALALHDWPRRAARALRAGVERGALLFLAAAAGGIIAELLKLLLRRERPWAHDGEHVFRSFAERPFSTSGLALPSSHALIAFAAATMLSRLFPRAAPVWYAAAAGCAISRVLAGAHFVSDVVVAAIAGYAVAALLWRGHTRGRNGTAPATILH